MTTDVTVKVNGRYRTTIKQDDRDPVIIEGPQLGGVGEQRFYLPHPAKGVFEISEEYVPEEQPKPSE